MRTAAGDRPRRRRHSDKEPNLQILKEEVPGFSREYPRLEVERRSWLPWAFLGLFLALLFFLIRAFLRMVDELLKG
jgi:hypothetical protein